MNPLVKEPLGNSAGTLTIGGVPVTELIEKFGTPLYVIDELRIRRNYRHLKETLEHHIDKIKIYYSVKANSNISVLKILLDEGSSLDATSPGEIFLGLKAGYPPDRIMYTGTSVGDEDLEYALKSDVTINLDSKSQFERLLKIKVPNLISVRLNPDVGSGHHKHVITGGVGSKFGLPKEEALEIYKLAKKAGINRFGFHMHIGSGNLSLKPYISALRNLLELVMEVKKDTGVRPDFIDVGGGIGVPYKPDETEFPLNEFAEEISKLIGRYDAEHDLGGPAVYLEPGRFIVCDSTILLTKINDVKKTSMGSFIGVDAGFNTLLRPAMYGSYHGILPASGLDKPMLQECHIVGPLCESGDVFGHYKMPRLIEGDLLAVLNAGAYGFSMSSQYNARPRPGEVLVKNGKFELIREKESFDDLLKSQRIPSWLR